ncbi:hypothetical protein A3A93_00740 [Candidatus Roizmanbacteria bacterium RIFCSPLOWO2_01_FULL_38_12]|uniref:Glycosyltransferase RgtA/B/C/D-like domain-containing protein n=1 Tax=Candidatus Roizmanbacteria bacterium RIFCSPLOWO2_01_FULL_38_12 TaxID=1802061 RepID=A0A1F7J099_9BACT|nr:MAG: hypothetical protein A3F59_01415 [Candidatus Roizmanbacteria bacterium RIFCSPHIGHO2_12_FULL_38_13]OGK49022.1 MAG: hypothetical protein A3A93_00740 [Candidatus Roizmanbacteria bacterium RIFCSPLOWO2_01_FULL_38_12]
MKKKFQKYILPFCIVFLLFAFLRFYNLERRIEFSWDQEQFSTQIREIVRDNKFTLLGPRVTDDKGFFLAPYFTYLLLPFYLTTNLHPSALVPFLYVVNTIFFVMASFTISQISNVRFALFFLILWAINPLLVHYDTKPWWPVLIPLGVIIIWFLIYKIYEKNELKYWLLLGITLGIFMNMHFQFIFICAFAFIFLIIHYSKKIKQVYLKMIFLITSFALIFIPLLLFDLRHDYLNTRLFINYFTSRALDDSIIVFSWKPVLTNLILPLTGIKNPNISIIFLILMGGGLLYLIKIRKNFQRTFYISTLILLILTVLGFSFYGSRPSEYYFVYLYPFIYIFIADILISSKNTFVSIFAIIFLIIINASDLKKSIQDHPGGLYYKDIAVRRILQYTKDKKVNIAFDMPPGNDGYYYFMKYYRIESSQNPSDPTILLRIPPKNDDIRIKSIGLHIPKELK